MTTKMPIVIQGAANADDVPGITALHPLAELRFASTTDTLRDMLPGAQALFGWDFRAESLQDAWHAADTLRWVHWSGAGVDAVLFPQLANSDVVLTNSRGIYDRAMAEYVLGTVIAFAKGFPETWSLQAARRWKHRFSDIIEGRCVLIVGVGSIGRAIATLLQSVGLGVSGIGRRARRDDEVFGTVHGIATLNEHLPMADYVVVVTPLTPATAGLFDAPQFRAMKSSAVFINVARGAVVNEAALIDALSRREIAAAGLDVFATEPLPVDSPLWSMPNVMISPHMSGDFHGYTQAVAELFIANFHRFLAGKPLRNVVDKGLGFVTA